MENNPLVEHHTEIKNNFAKIILDQIISYLRYSQKIPMFFGFALMFLIIVIGFQSSNMENLSGALLRPFVGPSGNANYDKSDFIKLYGKLSFYFYLVGTIVSLILKKIFNLSFNLNFKSKTTAAIIIAALGYSVGFILSIISKHYHPELSTLPLWLFILFFFITILASAYGFFIDAIMDALSTKLEQKTI